MTRLVPFAIEHLQLPSMKHDFTKLCSTLEPRVKTRGISDMRTQGLNSCILKKMTTTGSGNGCHQFLPARFQNPQNLCTHTYTWPQCTFSWALSHVVVKGRWLISKFMVVLCHKTGSAVIGPMWSSLTTGLQSCCSRDAVNPHPRPRGANVHQAETWNNRKKKQSTTVQEVRSSPKKTHHIGTERWGRGVTHQ